MVALTYDVRTVRIPVPRVVLGAGRERLRRVPRPALRRPALRRPDWAWTELEAAELEAAERRRMTHRDTALATRAGAGF
ncbi:hypothetical protein [Cellulomonas sp. URHE0023]|uniref:hypothetical protein n=1 Tax=Cellulomonas sp. URHE0023 TaxID=1380354 RepID=UPI0004835025|nr:hypothetical protein [Cellulomonas sp. URHE0023]